MTVVEEEARVEEGVGIHYSLQDRESWDSLGPVRGQILEVYLPDCIEGAPDIWAGLLVMQVEMDNAGELFAEVKSLGCSDAHYTKELSSMFNRRRGVVHFCMTSDCLEEINGLHITQVILHDREGFHRPYMTHATTRQVNKWLNEDTAPGGPGNTLILGDTRGAGAALDAGAAERPGVLRNVRDPRVRKDRKDAEEQDGKPHPGEADKLGEERADKGSAAPRTPPGHLDADQKKRLRERLAAARAKMASVDRGGAGHPAVLPGGDGPPRLESLSPGYTASVLEDQIAAEMEDHHRGEGAEKKPEKRAEGPGEKGRAEKKAKKDRRDAVKKAEPAAIKDISTSNLQDQLALRAATVAQERQKKRQIEKKKEDKDPSKELLRILTKSLGKKKKEKKTGKKKRKKKRGSGGGDPGGGPSSSSGSGKTTSSLGGSSKGSSSDNESSSEETKLEPPLKRKSKEKPGSVLQLLVQHARDQLDQTAKVSVLEKTADPTNMGIKLASYFSIVVRPQMGQAMGPLREMHMLTQAMDLLRQGQLGLCGDVLAGRFMSLHQSALDGSWSSAKFLELMPLEDTSAAGSSVIMQARKHAKLAAKVANPDWVWGAGKAKGGRGKSSSWQDYGGDAKGKGKKGAKGRGKFKGGWSGAQGSEDPDTGKRKEKVPEK
jgi:hypothetical protein